MSFLVILVLLIVVLWAASALFMKGEDLSPYDLPGDPDASVSFPGHEGPSQGHWEAVAAIEQFGLQAVGLSRKQRLKFMREWMAYY